MAENHAFTADLPYQFQDLVNSLTRIEFGSVNSEFGKGALRVSPFLKLTQNSELKILNSEFRIPNSELLLIVKN